MAFECEFTEEEMAIDGSVGYPKAYAKLCGDRHSSPYMHGPPFTFTPYSLSKHEAQRARELDQMFPIISLKAKRTAKPKIFLSLLWKQLNHLGNAGFDPAVIRVDTYGNVLYYHADSASPLAWDIDHWFPCSRGGLTVPSNLRILQWQAFKKKHNKLEFLIPWWDFQMGISVNQFLSIFASSNSDFRHRAFSFLFSEGENEELNATQTVESHSFPQHYVESKEKLGLAPAAIVVSRRECYDSSSSTALRSLDYNKQPRPHSPLVAARKVKPSLLKENENPDFVSNPYQAVVIARDSLKQREESAKMNAEMEKLDNEVDDMRRKNEEERLTIQDLEMALIKRKRKVEKCRRLAEAQTSYRTMLEKMIRDAMHQSVVYKEQVRLNQAASNALMARLEAQKAICNSAEKELHQKFRKRDELEKQLRPEWEHARKRSRTDDDALFEERENNKPVLYLPGIIKPKPHLHKELRVFLEEEQRACKAAASSSHNEEQKGDENEEALRISAQENDDTEKIADKIQKLELGEGKKYEIRIPVFGRREIEGEEDEESRKTRGKGNVEKWLQMLLENSNDELDTKNENEETRINQKFPQTECEDEGEKHNRKIVQGTDSKKEKGETFEIEDSSNQKEKGSLSEVDNNIGSGDARIRRSMDGRDRNEQNGKEKKLVRSESARAFRRIPSSPSLILGMRKGVVTGDCIGKKPMLTGDDDDDFAAGNSFIKSSMKTLKKAVKL